MSAVETITSAPPAVENPFKFLDYYAETDKSYFGGRDAEIREVTAGIMKHPTFVLYGRSGLGKTSLLLAGVFPELRSCRYSPVHVRLLQNPVEDLRAAVRDTLGQPCDADHPEPLDALIRRAAASAPVVLALDQFEEFFIRFRDEPELQHQFAESLGHLLRDHNLPVRVVFSIREDYIAELDDLRAELPDLLGHSYRLHPLSPFGARQAMVKTLMTAQVDYETRLITSLVEMIVADGRLEPTVLQIVCYEMYAHAAKRPERPVRLTEADLKQVGGLDGIFRRYLEDVIKQIDPASLLLARAVLDSLITSERTKRAVTLADLLAAGFEAKAEEISAMIDALVKARVIRGDTRGLQMWYELAHERLVRPLLDWFALDDDYSSFRRVRSLIADNSRDELWRKNVGLLLTKGAVALAGKYRLRLKLDPLQSEFVLWGAILHLSPDLSHWRGACGDDVTARALQIMLAMAGGDTRGAAAQAAGVLRVETPALREQLRALALSDGEPSVRRAAGAALAAGANADDIAAVRKAIETRATRKAGVEIVADGYGERVRLPIGWDFWALVAYAWAWRLFWKRNDDIIRRRVSDGTRSGFLAAAAWVGTIGFAFSALVMWALTSEPDAIGAPAIGTGFAGMAVATLLARLTVKHSVRRMIRGADGWFRAVVAATLLPSLAVALLIAWFLRGVELRFVIAAGAAVAIVVLWGGLTAYARPLVSGQPLQPMWMRSAAVNFGLPMASACAIAAATVLVLRFVHPFNAELAKVVIVTAISTGLLASLGGFVLTTGLARAFSDDAPLPAERTRGRELFAGACAAFVLGLFLMFYSPRLIPPLVSPQRLEVGGGIDGSVALGPGWPDVTYVKLDATADGWTRVDLPSADVANVADVQLDGNPLPPGDGKSYFAFITVGPHTLAFSNDAAWQGTKQSGTFAIASIPFLKDKNVILQTPHGPIIMQLPLARDGMKKTGRVQVTVDPALIAGRAADKLQLRARVVGSIGAAPSLSFATLRITGGHSQEAARPFGGMTTMMSAPANFLSDDPTLNDNGWHLDINSDRGVTIDATIDYTQSDPSVKGLRRFSNQWSLDHEPASLLLALDVIDAGTAIAVRQIVLDKFQAEQLNNRAWLLHQTGNDKNAYDLATQATSLDDSQAAYQDTLAHTAYATGRYAEAVKAWDRVLQLDPKFYTPLRDAECARDKDLLATARQKASAKP